MKTKMIKMEDRTVELKSMGFFRANRLLMGMLFPLFETVVPLVADMDEEKSSMDDIMAGVIDALDSDVLENIIIGLLNDRIFVNGSPIEIEDLELGEGYELAFEAISLNYSSLGKLFGKLKKMLPKEMLEKLEKIKTLK